MTLFLNLVAFGIVIPVLPFYAQHFGASPKLVTLLSTTFSLGAFVMSPVLGRLSDRFGRRPVMLISIAGSCISMLILGFAQTLGMVFLARVVSGVSSANVSTAQAYVADRVEPAERARYMGMMGAAIGMGFVFGPAIGGLLSLPGHPELPFLCAAGLNGLNWLLALFLLPESRRSTDSTARVRRPQGWQAMRHGLGLVWGTVLGWLILVSFIFFLAFSAMESTFALLMEAELGWGARETGYLFTGLGLVIAVTQGIVVGRLVDRIGERGTLLVGLSVLATGLMVTGTAAQPLWVVLGTVGIATGNGLITPSVTTLISRISDDEHQGLALGLNASAGSAARIVGPAGAGVAFETLGPGVPMIIASGVVIGGVLVAAGKLPTAQGSERTNG